MKTIKVLIIDDSVIMQNLLKEMLAADPEILVVGVANDPYEARDLIKSTNPDVLTLDIMMPKMDGISFLKNLMRLRPMPVVMVSSLVQDGNDMAVEALENGAIDYLTKPTAAEITNPARYATKLAKAIKIAATANVKNREISSNLQAMLPEVIFSSEQLSKLIVTIGSSTGGIEALESFLPRLPKIFPPVLIAQHIKRSFSTVFVNHLSKFCNMLVSEAKNGEKFSPGHIYIAPAGAHMKVIKQNFSYHCFLDSTDTQKLPHPSVDLLFNSAALSAGKNTIAILLTGMGTDGAKGLKMIKESGGTTIAQDKASSVIWGMPGAAVKMNAAEYVIPLHEIPQKLMNVIDSKLHSD